MEKSIFRQESLDRISSPDELNSYIRVFRPGIWLLTAAAALLLIGFLVWSKFGVLQTTVPVVCVADGGKLTTYVADVGEIKAGQTVRIGDMRGTVETVSDMPYSSEEIAGRYDSDYTVHLLGIQDWNYEVVISAPDVPDGMVEGTVVTDAVHPIEFIFG